MKNRFLNTVIVLILVFWSDIPLQAQSVITNITPGIKGMYSMKFDIALHNDFQACADCSDDYWFYKYYRLGLGETQFATDCIPNGATNPPYHWYGNDSITFSVDNVVNRLYAFGQRYTRPSSPFASCNEYHSASDDKTLSYFDYTTGQGYYYYNGWFFENDDYILHNSGQSSTRTVKIIPHINYLATLNASVGSYLPILDKLQFKAPYGFPKAVYNWQYGVSNGATIDWFNFPATLQGDSIVNFSATDLFGANVGNYTNRTINIRLRAPGPPTMNNEILSDIVPLTVIKDAPRITSSISKPTSCFDALDGSAKITFNRNITSGEQLSILIKRYESATNTWSPGTPTANLTSLTNNSYSFPDTLQPGLYAITLFGTIAANGYTGALYSGNPQYHYDTFEVQKPLPVAFSTTKTNVRCYDGDDGIITINATGGVGQFKYQFNSTTTNDTAWYAFAAANQHNRGNLLPGTYYIKVKDANGCIAKTNGGLGVERIDTIIITQPSDSLHIDLVSQQDATAYGFNDGYINVAVYGGTAATGNTYNYTWYDANNTVVSTHSASVQSGAYHIGLQQIGAGTYTLVIQDGNFNTAINQVGCTKTVTFIIEQPFPIELDMELVQMPSCNKSNTEQDPFADGILAAHVTGGTPFLAPALPYIYTWKKKDAQNNWQVMSGYTDSVAAGLEEGWYAVNVEDFRGIKLGTYVNNVLTQEIDSTFYMPQHDLLSIASVITPIACNGDTSGAITLNVSGGVAPYTYSWSTGDTVHQISNIAAGGYFIFVKDSNQCRATQSIFVPQPDMFQLAVDSTAPICHNACDGTINLTLTGGTMPYTFDWNGIAGNSPNVSGLCAGTYTVHISDAEGCGFDRIITLDNPEPLLVNMPKDTTLCNGQTAPLDISINDPLATYVWTSNNGFAATSPQVILTDAGTYIATITDSNQCVGTDTLVLNRVQVDISADILLPTQAMVEEEIILVNVSHPIPEIVEWQVPQGISILEENDKYLRFKAIDTGVYSIKLRTGIGLCREEIVRDVIVSTASNLPQTGNNLPPFIQDVSVLPNPSTGNFTVLVKLKEIGSAKIRILQSNSAQSVTERTIDGHKEYAESFSIPTAGVYILIIEANRERKTLKLIIQ